MPVGIHKQGYEPYCSSYRHGFAWCDFAHYHFTHFHFG
jgi:hypothetical protein